MGFFYTDDPVADAERHLAEQDKQVENLPVCDYCGDPIQEDFYIIDGDCYCEHCLDNHFKKRIDDYIA